MSLIDMTNKQFGRLTVIKRAPNGKNTNVQWHCQCECGAVAIVRGDQLRSGRASSCGCLQRDRSTTHGLRHHPLYDVWHTMKQRCNDKDHPSFHHYGGRGITVCKEWNDFENFYNDMISSYQKGLDIDRRNNDLGYCPSNCRWVTRSVNCLNRRKPKNSSSQYRGVSWRAKSKRWVAQVSPPGQKRQYIGSFTEELDAALAYDTYVHDNKLPNHLNFS